MLLYGAVMDGVTDDGAAIQDAIDDCGARGGGTVEVPEGIALVERTLVISSDNVVLRGAGKGETTIKIPHSLLYYDYLSGKREGEGLAKSRAFLEIRGKPTRSTDEGRNYVGKVLTETKAGYRSLQLDDASGIIAGEYIQLFMSDPRSGPAKKSLVGYLYESKDPKSRCGDECLKELRGWKDLVRFMSRVVEVRGNTIVLERELPVDVRPEWQPVVFTLNEDTVQNSGIQDLTVEFNWIRTKKHLYEDGFNAIVLLDTAFSWVRNVEVVNADLNVVVRRSNFVTVQGIVARVTKDRSHPSSRKNMGHIGIGVHQSSDVDVSDFDLQERWWHDLSVSATMLCVFRNGKGKDINMDLHRSAPYMTLYENIDIGKGTRPFTSGNPGAGKPTASYATFYNIRTSDDQPIKEPSCSFGGNMNLVGNFKEGAGNCKGRVIAEKPKGSSGTGRSPR